MPLKPIPPLPFLATLVLLALPLAARAEQRVRLIDQLGPGEIEETTSVYLDDVLAGTFRLDASAPSGQFSLAVPDAPNHPYRLCGKVVTRSPSGEVETHVVDTSGTLGEVDGRVFEAMTADFTSYFLEDVTPDRRPSDIGRNQGRGCAPAVS